MKIFLMFFVVLMMSAGFAFAPIQEADVDIKPGSFPNSINPNYSKGIVSVAILSTDDFDALNVDVSTVAFGPDGAMAVHEGGHMEDVNEDGLTDLVFHFSIPETGIMCGDIEAHLTGMLLDGTPFQGVDSIKTVGCR
jgi:hypothetical protein